MLMLSPLLATTATTAATITTDCCCVFWPALLFFQLSYSLKPVKYQGETSCWGFNRRKCSGFYFTFVSRSVTMTKQWWSYIFLEFLSLPAISWCCEVGKKERRKGGVFEVASESRAAGIVHICKCNSTKCGREEDVLLFFSPSSFYKLAHS